MSETNTIKEPNIEGLSDDDALNKFGCLIDAAYDLRSKAATDRAFVLLEGLPTT